MPNRTGEQWADLLTSASLDGDNAITLTFTFDDNPPPADVLVEHMGFTIRQDFKETKLADIKVRQHPFEGPEVFDDTPQREEYTGPRREEKLSVYDYGTPVFPGASNHSYLGPAFEEEKEEGPVSPWPLVDRVIRSLRNRK